MAKVSGTANMCCHVVEWWYDIDDAPQTPELLGRLAEEAEARAKSQIIEGVRSGDLCCCIPSEDRRTEDEFFGSWAIRPN
jgi:hypothetical protein